MEWFDTTELSLIRDIKYALMTLTVHLFASDSVYTCNLKYTREYHPSEGTLSHQSQVQEIPKSITLILESILIFYPESRPRLGPELTPVFKMNTKLNCLSQLLGWRLLYLKCILKGYSVILTTWFHDISQKI